MSNELAKGKEKKLIVTSVSERIKEMQEQGMINFPPTYSAQNALQSAWSVIQETRDINGRKALEICTIASISSALMNTVIQGLNPLKNQIYYIVYGDQLKATRSYFGTIAVVKRIPGVKDIFADVVYEGDKFLLSKHRGTWKIEEHSSGFENINPDKIVAAYCTIEFDDGREPYTEIMNMEQIQRSWNKSRSSKRQTHKEFPDQMAKRTVINRACKWFFSTSNDQDLIMEAFTATGEQFEQETPQSEPEEDSRLIEVNAAILDELPEEDKKHER